MSFYSAEARPPKTADLAGVLCGPGQAVSFGRGSAARLSIVVADAWRADALVAACAQRGVAAEVGMSEEGHPLVRTAFRADLTALAASWLRGAVKAVPAGFTADGGPLRMWALVAGNITESGYVLDLDPHSDQTHQPLVDALARAGIPVTLLGARAGGPSVRISGARRLSRLAELVGDRPARVPLAAWPAPAAAHGLVTRAAGGAETVRQTRSRSASGRAGTTAQALPLG
jgi:hypothetical protein